MTYRNELEQAHRRIEQLEDELEAEREKNAPKKKPEPAPPVVSPPAKKKEEAEKSLLDWWPIAVIAIGASAIAIMYGFDLFKETDRSTYAGLALSAIVGSIFYTIDIAIRRVKGERNVLARIALVLAVITGAPAIIMAFQVGGVLIGVGVGVVFLGWGIYAAARWIIKGKG